MTVAFGIAFLVCVIGWACLRLEIVMIELNGRCEGNEVRCALLLQVDVSSFPNREVVIIWDRGLHVTRPGCQGPAQQGAPPSTSRFVIFKSPTPHSNAQNFLTFQSLLELDFDRHSFALQFFPVGILTSIASKAHYRLQFDSFSPPLRVDTAVVLTTMPFTRRQSRMASAGTPAPAVSSYNAF